MHIFQTYRRGKIRFVCFDDMCTHSEREREYTGLPSKDDTVKTTQNFKICRFEA